ncbi:phospholipase [Acetobacteraceae bacterium H6797]|nr:phospholipase [Acetobacteraceae bacterium H6797]
MPSLKGPQWGPASGGKPKMLVVLVHGVGADGNDLIDLAPYWGKTVPDALFVSPHAPEPYDQAPMGRQWFSLRDRSPARMAYGVRAVAPVLDTYIAELCAEHGLPESAVVLMGFSQGAMTSLFTGLRRKTPPAGIMAYAGALIDPDSLAAEITGKPRVLIVHGLEDEVVVPERGRAAEEALKALGLPVESLWCPGLGHGIDDAGISTGALFLQRAASEIEDAA